MKIHITDIAIKLRQVSVALDESIEALEDTQAGHLTRGEVCALGESLQLAHEAQHAATNLARALATLTTEKAQQIAALAKLDPDFPEL